jgi:hypothetical protein
MSARRSKPYPAHEDSGGGRMAEAPLHVEFGYLPEPHDFPIGDITVSTLPGLAETRIQIEKHDGVANGWIYAPPQRVVGLSREESEMPYPSRVFGLPKTHSLAHATATDPEHLSFLVWMFGFINGMRLTDTEMGFLDATPIKPGALNDIVWLGQGKQHALGFADAFWSKHGPRISKGLSGVVHALFLSSGPHLLDFEKLLYVYAAIDGCHAVWGSMKGRKPTSVPHRKRLVTLCRELGTVTPTWIEDVVDSRNNALHEALFFDEPLGFAGFGGNNPQAIPRGNTILELRSLVSRFVCAILGLPCPKYISSPVHTRQIFGVTV